MGMQWERWIREDASGEDGENQLGEWASGSWRETFVEMPQQKNIERQPFWRNALEEHLGGLWRELWRVLQWPGSGSRVVLGQMALVALIALETPGAIGMFYLRSVPSFGCYATIYFVIDFTSSSQGPHSPSFCSTPTFGDLPLGCSKVAAAAGPQRHHRQRTSHPDQKQIH